MKWSWQIARIAGIRVRVHATFALLIVLPMLSGWRRGSPVTVFGTVTLVLAVFVLVVLHECGHALVARRFGIHTRDIMLRSEERRVGKECRARWSRYHEQEKDRE